MLRIVRQDQDLVWLEANGEVSEKDYREVVPLLEAQLAREGRLRALIHLRDFRGWSAEGGLEELRFDLRHREGFDRVAVVGARPLEAWGARLTAPFFSGPARFFEDEQELQAREWFAHGRDLAEPRGDLGAAFEQAG